MSGLLLVSTTAGSRDAAAELLRSVVRAKLAAGGQVFGPAMSAFWHEGEYGEGKNGRCSSRPAQPTGSPPFKSTSWKRPPVAETRGDGTGDHGRVTAVCGVGHSRHVAGVIPAARSASSVTYGADERARRLRRRNTTR